MVSLQVSHQPLEEGDIKVSLLVLWMATPTRNSAKTLALIPIRRQIRGGEWIYKGKTM
jgi:hypothetical protein